MIIEKSVERLCDIDRIRMLMVAMWMSIDIDIMGGWTNRVAKSESSVL